MVASNSIEKLDKLITKGEAVLRTHREHAPNVIGFPTLDSGSFEEWKTQAVVFLASAFGSKHGYVTNFKERVKQGYQGTVKAGLGILKAAREDLIAMTETKPAKLAETSNVFVVHGHDDEMKQHVARTLTALGLTPIILHEQPNAGNTIIEKFEANAGVSFAVVLLSPDDKGFPADKNGKQAKPRARQNVILELGYFIGKLGRGRVFPLKRGENLELPSDFHGIVYTPYDAAGHWRLELVRELKAAGFAVDANKLIP